MGLFELCLISLLAPQEPEAALPHATAVPAQPAAAIAAPAAAPSGGSQAGPTGGQGPQDPPAVRLHAAESATDQADPEELLALTMGKNPAIAARAAWLLGNSERPECRGCLEEVLASSPHAGARLQAIESIRGAADITATPIAIQALSDNDRAVRTLAAQLLGRLRRPASVEPLLGLINASAKAGGDEPATDIQAALLALTDIGAEEQLLRMATAIHDGSPKATGPALAYAFERLSPTLSPADEATVLVAALGHAEPIVRRYAITRLTELGNADALAALEGRLAAEGDELRPLVEVAIAQLRDAGKPAPQNEVERAKANAKVLWAKTTSWWSGLSLANQGMIGASPILLLVVFTLLRRAGRRRAQAADAQAAAAWVQPSDEYLDQQDEGFDEDNYEDDFDPEFDEGEYTEQGDLEGDSFEDDGQPKFDTSGWEDDSDKQAVPDGANPEDDLFR